MRTVKTFSVFLLLVVLAGGFLFANGNGLNKTQVIVLIKNTTNQNVKFSWYSPSGQKWCTLQPQKEDYIAIKKGPSGNFLLKVVENGRDNYKAKDPNRKQGDQVIILLKNTLNQDIRFSWYSPSGQKWATLNPGKTVDANVKKGPSGNFLIKVVENEVSKTIIKWNGKGYNSQVNAYGSVTLTKIGKKVSLEGTFSISSPTYGYVRHELPPGFKPISTDHMAYPFAVQLSETKGDTSNVNNYGGKGVYALNDDYKGYENGDIWFPEKFYNGKFTLRGEWETNEKDCPEEWKKNPGIQVIK